MPTTPSPGRRPRRLIMDDDDDDGHRAPEVAAAGTQRVEAESAQDLVRNPLAPSSSSQPAAALATGAQPAEIIEIDGDDRAPEVPTGGSGRVKAESARDSVRNPLAFPSSSQPAEIIEIPDEEDVGEAGAPGALIKEEPVDAIDWHSLLFSSEEEGEAPRSDESTSSGGPDGGTASDGNSNGIGTSRREGACDDGEEKEEEEVEMPDAEDKDGAEEGHEEEEPEEEEEDKDEDEWEEEEDEEEEESDEDSEESEAEEEPGHRMLSDARGTGRHARPGPGGDGRRAEIFLKRKFEGWYITKLADTASTGSTVASRTRSQRRCPDAKLLRQATRRKPYCVDTPSQSSSEAEEDDEDKPPPHPARSSSEDREGGGRGHGRTGKRHPRRRRGQNADDDCDEHDGTATRRRRGPNAAHSDEDFEEPGGMAAARRRGKQRMEEDNAADGGDERKKEGAASCRQAAGRKNKDFPADGWEQQGDVTFKKSSLLPPRRQGGQDRETYDDLLYSIFEGIETTLQNASVPLDAPVPAQEQGGDPFPVVFSFGVQDEVVPEKTHLDDLWADLDLALDLDAESNKVSSHTCHKDAGSDEHEIPAHGATFCKRGKHDLFHDDQIGVRCRKCDYIEIEIRDVFPSMAKESTDREPAMEHDDFDLFFDDILKSVGYEGASSMGGGDKTGVVWDLIPGVREDMFPHQREGFEFMWRKLAGGIDIEQLRHTMNTDTTSGCVISHAPGTGKTRLAITFVQSYLELFPHCRPVIIAPRGMLATWEQEFSKWNVKLPFHVLSSSEIQWDQDKTIQKLVSKDQGLGQKLAMKKLSQKSKMMLKLASWYEGSSIIGLSYSLYRNLAKGEGKDGEMQRNLLLEKPGLLVLDEGHTPRNKKSLIWKILAEVSTEKRIILSGTPFQNNFLELYNILCLVKPKFAKDFACTRLSKKGVASTSQSSRAAPHLEEDDGKEFWSSLRISNITDEHITEIREKLGPFVHIHNGDILQKSLPGLRESVVILNPLPRQKEIIEMMEESAGKGFLDAEYKISLASIHPFLVTSTKLSDTEAAVVDKMKSVRLNPSEGVKTWFVFEIIRICEALHERVLVFSQYLEPLALIVDQLTRKLDWTEGKEILLMSGNVRVKQREALMEAFNDMNSEAKVMLASTKACCEGITLVGASRVVLLDVVWNPSVGRQAIGRAYRIGQEKIVYTYNLIAEGTKEKVKYDRQATKDHMSKLLFSNEPQPTGSNLSPELISNDRILEAMAAREDLKDMEVR